MHVENLATACGSPPAVNGATGSQVFDGEL